MKAIESILFFIAALYLLGYAWLVLIRGETVLTLPAQFALWLLNLAAGPAAARRREIELSKPEKIHLSGIYALLTGIIFLVAGTIRFLQVINILQ